MQLVKIGSTYVAISTFAEKDILKKAKFRWDPDEKRWWTCDVSKAARLAKYADSTLQAELNGVAETIERNLEASRATDSDMVIPHPDGVDYMPFQRAGIAYAADKEGVLIGDEMGLGKTIQAAGIINLDAKARRVLVICPATPRLNWKQELEKWLVRPLSIGIVDTKKDFPETDVVIMNFDIVHKYPEKLREHTWDILIVDEAHYLKNKKARRTQHVLGRKHGRGWTLEPIKARKRVFLTGTPICNRPAELWPLVNSLCPSVFRSWGYYSKRYCDAKYNGWGWDFSGSSNLDELQRLLREHVMVRRLKADVLTDLPPKIRQVIEIPSNGCGKLVEAEQQAWSKHEDLVVQLRAAVELAKASDNPSDYQEAVRALADGVRVAFQEMSKLRRETALAKIPYVLSFLEDVTDKVVLFAHHKDVVKALKEALGERAVVLVGDTPLNERQAAVDRFQNDESVQFFIGSIMAAGTAITLTASAHVIFCELDWVPGNMSQCEDRTHRIGQKNSVLVQHLVFEGSIDATMAKKLVKKQKVIDRALDDKSALEIPEVTIDEPATARVTRKQVIEESTTITPEQVALVHAGLQTMAGMCDGAHRLDGAGFNRFDARIGHELAARGYLTAKAAVIGRKILRKYHHQLGKDFVKSLG